jgi:NOL1/NOP2/sun family putative RNA methylase
MAELLKNPKQFADPKKIQLKESFEKKYRLLLGDNFDEFMKYSLTYLRTSIRVNTLKISISDLKKRLEDKGFELEQVPWCKEGFWVYGDRKDLGNLLEHTLGYIYIQEAMSMVPPLALEPKPGDKILDMCAAPGSKTTQIAQFMENDGMLIANDTVSQRARPLGLNTQRLGIRNIALTLRQGQQFVSLPENYFDRILVDAPCSGTGTIRKSLKTLNQVSDGFVKKMQRIQMKLLETAFKLVKKGGVIVYSTCTLEPWEDEAVISYLANNFDCTIEPIKLNGLKSAKPVMEFMGERYHEAVKNCLRVYPQQYDTEGFFVTKIIKN